MANIDIEPSTLDFVMCGHSDFLPFTTADNVDNDYIFSFNTNIVQHYIIHWPTSFDSI